MRPLLCLLGFHKLHFNVMLDSGNVMWCERCGRFLFRRWKPHEKVPD